MDERTRQTGVDAIGAVPWGTHLCLFYETKQDLLDILVPFFKAGLENNEFCIWVTSESLKEKEVKAAMRKAVPDFAQYLKRGQIEIIPHTEWYLKDSAFNLQRVLNAWMYKLNQALANGYDGPGISAEHMDKLFDPFFTTRGEKGGTGLGLSVCHSIVAQHGGRLYVKSKPGKGATFFVKLPLTSEKIDESRVVEEQPAV